MCGKLQFLICWRQKYIRQETHWK